VAYCDGECQVAQNPRQTHEFGFFLTKAQRNTKITKYLFDIFFVTYKSEIFPRIL